MQYSNTFSKPAKKAGIRKMRVKAFVNKPRKVRRVKVNKWEAVQ